MEKILKLFIATRELYQSPLISPLVPTYDAALTIGEKSTITYSLPLVARGSEIELSYNPHMLEILKVTITRVPSTVRSTLKILVQGRDLGQTQLSVYIQRLRSPQNLFASSSVIMRPQVTA